MKLLGIDHIGILVKNIDSAMKVYSVMGLKPALIEENEAYKVKIAFLPVSGGVLVELIEPIGPGRLKEQLENYGEGIDHIAFKVDDIEKSLRELKEQGISLQDETPATRWSWCKSCLFEKEGANNVSIELKEGGSEIV